MAKFIELTNYNTKGKVFVNMDKVLFMKQTKKERVIRYGCDTPFEKETVVFTEIHLNDYEMLADETPEEIMDKIKEK